MLSGGSGAVTLGGDGERSVCRKDKGVVTTATGAEADGLAGVGDLARAAASAGVVELALFITGAVAGLIGAA